MISPVGRQVVLTSALGHLVLDYGRRIAGVTSWLSLSGDQGQDLAHIRAFYADKTGLHPALAGKIRLRDDL